MIRGIVKSYEAAAAIAAFTIVAFSDAANSSKVAAANGSGAPLVGTTGKVGASAAGAEVDVNLTGLPQVTLGGPVSAGDWLTSDAAGNAVKVTAAGQQTIGHADHPGVAGDVITYMAAPGVVGGA